MGFPNCPVIFCNFPTQKRQPDTKSNLLSGCLWQHLKDTHSSAQQPQATSRQIIQQAKGCLQAVRICQNLRLDSQNHTVWAMKVQLFQRQGMPFIPIALWLADTNAISYSKLYLSSYLLVQTLLQSSKTQRMFIGRTSLKYKPRRICSSTCQLAFLHSM